MPKKKKVKKSKKTKVKKITNIKKNKKIAKSPEKKGTIPGSDEKPEIKKIKNKQLKNVFII